MPGTRNCLAGAPQPTPNEIAKALYVGGLGGPILKFKYTVEQDIDRGALNSVFTAAALLNADQVLEDVAGSTVIGKSLVMAVASFLVSRRG